MQSLSSNQFERLFAEGHSLNFPFFRIIGKQGTGRFGIATSKKLGCHARRNRTKRRIKEIFSAIDAPMKQDFDLIIVVKNAANREKYSSLRESLWKNLEEVNIRLDKKPVSS